MITIDNYFEEINRLDLSSLPEPLQKGHEFVVKATDSGQTWQSYHEGENTHKAIDIYLSKLNEYVSKQVKPSREKKEKPSPRRQDTPSLPAKTSARKTPEPQSSAPNVPTLPPPEMVERIPEELRIIRRFVNMDEKTKTKEEILRFINSLQKAIVEKRIRKSSAYAEQIRFIQDKLIEVHNSMKAKIKIELKPETKEEMKALTGEQKVLPSINFIKRYMGMNGKTGIKEKAGQLLDQINRAMDKGNITDSDPYIIEIHAIKKHLKAFTSGKGQKVLEIEKATLNGLNGVLGCACQSLNGPEEKPVLMNSIDFANMQFKTIGLKGKWYDLIGDPSPNFTAMVFGKPKMGKSYLCIDFAGYLARHHGKVLYVAKEEGLDMTLQKKLADKNVAHPNLFVASELPTDLNRYHFVFLDSVNKLQLNPTDLTMLKRNNPFQSFIFIFQSTKEGNFRGANSFQHDVDVVIEIPEKGVARQYGRFNQGAEISVFNGQQEMEDI
jgi:hypothetical protein